MEISTFFRFFEFFILFVHVYDKICPHTLKKMTAGIQDVPDEIGRVNGSSMMELVDEGVIALKVSTKRGLVDAVEGQIGG